MTTVQETSKEVYYREVVPTLGNRQRVVLREIGRYVNVTNSELAASLDWPINTITPRVKELRKACLVREWGKRPCRITGKRVIAWEINRSTLF